MRCVNPSIRGRNIYEDFNTGESENGQRNCTSDQVPRRGANITRDYWTRE